MRIAAATPSAYALAAAFEVAARGGGAIDSAIAAVAVAMVTEVGICGPGSGGFLLVSSAGDTVAYDGYVTAPGHGGVPEQADITEVRMEYGGGVSTLVGPGSIATPGVWAGMEAAHRDHGRVEWAWLLEPASRLARAGFSYGSASIAYLAHVHDSIYGRDPASSSIVHRPDGTIRGAAEMIVIPDLADSLDMIGREGAASLHTGRLCEMISEDLIRRRSILAGEDLRRYVADRRPPLVHGCGEWEVATNPAPAVGGEALVGVLERIQAGETGPVAMAAAQLDVFGRRRSGDALRSPSTIHVSVVDEAGTACAMTASSGYGSGVIPRGTGIYMNNALGELELVGDFSALEPGARLVSNMAPTVCRHPDGSVLAIGSPGADRITSALAHTLVSFLLEGRTLTEAVSQARLHVTLDGGPGLAAEPGIDVSALGLPVRLFDRPHMFFGGVGAALCDGSGRLTAVADPRRDGAAGATG